MDLTTGVAAHDRSLVRQDEFAELGRLVMGVREGRGITVQLTGEPGAGKTRLLTRVAREARGRGVTVVRGLSSEQQTAPFHPFVEALTLLRDGIADEASPTALALLRGLDALPGQAGRAGGDAAADHRGGAAVRRLLAGCASATPGGLLLLLDDFHWADRHSVELLDLIMRQPVEGGLALAVAYRPRQATAALRAAARNGVELGEAEELPLAPLTLAQSAALLDAAPDDSEVALLHRRSGGNPLYLTALAAARRPAEAGLEPHQPLRARLLAETAPLGRSAWLVARAAAVLGGSFDVDAVAAVADLPRSEACRALGELRRRDLVRSAAAWADRLLFRHPLLRDCVHEAGDSCWRTEAHRRALSHLAAAGAAPMELAPHIVGSGAQTEPGDRAVLEAAVRAVLPLGQSVQAAQWTVAALRLARAAGDSGTAPVDRGAEPFGPGSDLWLPVVQALAAEGRTAELDPLIGEILATLAAAPDTVRAAATARLATAQAALGRVDEGRALIDTALSELGHSAPLQAMLRVQAQLGRVLGGQLPTRADVGALAQQVACADQVTIGGCLVLRGLCAVFGGDLGAAEIALDAGAQALDEAEPEGPAACSYASFLTVLAGAESALGWYGSAHAHAERALAEVRLLGDVHLLPVLHNVQAYIAYQSGRMAEALDAARLAGAGARAVAREDQALLADALTAAAWGWLGSEGDGRQTAPGEPPACPNGPAVRAAALLSANGAARATLSALLLAEAALARGDSSTALGLLLPTPRAHRVSPPSAVLAARVYELLTAAAVAAGSNAEDWARRAEAAAEAVNLAEQTGYALLARGHVLAACDLSADAARCYDDAYRLLGETAAGARAHELALAVGCRGRAERPHELAQLTAREREVAELAGVGLKTRVIAEQLGLSPRTVDVHLAHIYDKTGVNSRAALARLMARAVPSVRAGRPASAVSSRADGRLTGPTPGRR